MKFTLMYLARASPIRSFSPCYRCSEVAITSGFVAQAWPLSA